ncbi:hypothetical protein GCM10011607_11320 [Shewanella inventionis]|uniref:Secreted protein n=1 Tax=Shewanella inventionis TaxID=1738770 RepID=A0ABQ1IX12_9GAMM|nr:hypothetical protein GCM10011607_11320 [Shewanella inventionis]
MANKRCPTGSAKNVLLFVEWILLRWLGITPFASIKTFLTRTKFNQQRSTAPCAFLRDINHKWFYVDDFLSTK